MTVIVPFYDWDDAAHARLTALWNEGLSSAEIGRRMNVSKNAVVGKAHRLGLASRPSPIKRADGYVRPVAMHRPRTTLPKLEAPVALKLVEHAPLAVRMPETRYTISGNEIPLNRLAQHRASVRGATIVFPSSGIPTPVPDAVVTHQPAARGCKWPTWVEKNAAYWSAINAGRVLECGASATPGHSYCPQHRALSCKGVQRQDDAA